MEPVYRALGVIALASNRIGRISGNGIPLNWLVMFLVGLFLGLAISEARESLANDARETTHLTVVQAVSRADMHGRRVAVKGRVALEHALSPGQRDKDETPDRAWIPMFNPERTRAMYVEVDLQEVPTDDVREEWVTGMLRPLNRELKNHLMTSGLLIDGIAPDARHMLVAGERPPRLWIWLTVAAVLALVLLAMLLVVPLGYTIFRRTREGLTGVDLSAAVAPKAADAAGDIGLRVTGRFALTPTDTQRFLNVPAVIAELESGETAFVSNIDASIDHMGAVERRAGAWIIVMKHGTLSPPEYGNLYTGRRHPALRIHFTDATTGKPSSAILAFSSTTTRDRVREALYDETRRKRVEQASASTAPSENSEQQRQGDPHEV